MDETKGRKVAIYLRVSSKEQAREGLSIEAQKNKLQGFAYDRKWDIYDIYLDAGKSGGSIKYRTEFQRLMQDARNKKFHVILVYKVDRFSRNLKDLILSLDELRKLEINFVSSTEPIDTTSAMGRAFFQIIGVFAELERMLTKERVDLILQDKFERGVMIGKPPIGYKWNKEKKRMEINKEKAQMVRQIFEMSLDSKHDYKSICAMFDLSKQTYYNIIKNSTYTGLVRFQGKKNKGSHRAIISQELFDKVNKKD